jgi:hypothetical protein
MAGDAGALTGRRDTNDVKLFKKEEQVATSSNVKSKRCLHMVGS